MLWKIKQVKISLCGYEKETVFTPTSHFITKRTKRPFKLFPPQLPSTMHAGPCGTNPLNDYMIETLPNNSYFRQ